MIGVDWVVSHHDSNVTSVACKAHNLNENVCDGVIVYVIVEHRTIVPSIHRELTQTVAKDPVLELWSADPLTWRSATELD